MKLLRYLFLLVILCAHINLASQEFSEEDLELLSQFTPEEITQMLESRNLNVDESKSKDIIESLEEEDREESETPSLEDEINLLKDDVTTTSTVDTTDDSVDVTPLDNEETDDLPF